MSHPARVEELVNTYMHYFTNLPSEVEKLIMSQEIPQEANVPVEKLSFPFQASVETQSLTFLNSKDKYCQEMRSSEIELIWQYLNVQLLNDFLVLRELLQTLF